MRMLLDAEYQALVDTIAMLEQRCAAFEVQLAALRAEREKEEPPSVLTGLVSPAPALRGVEQGGVMRVYERNTNKLLGVVNLQTEFKYHTKENP